MLSPTRLSVDVMLHLEDMRRQWYDHFVRTAYGMILYMHFDISQYCVLQNSETLAV